MKPSIGSIENPGEYERNKRESCEVDSEESGFVRYVLDNAWYEGFFGGICRLGGIFSNGWISCKTGFEI